MAIDPRAIPLLVDGLRPNDLAIGSRALADSMVESSYAMRSVMGRLFNRLVTTGTGLGLSDTQCGFKAFHTPVARLLFHLVRIDRFAFDVEVLVRAHRLGLRHHRGARPVDPRAREHRPSAPRLGLHAGRRLLLEARPAGHAGRPRHRRARPLRRRRSRRALAERVRSVVGRHSAGGVPSAVVADGRSVTVLLPLVDPADAAPVVDRPAGRVRSPARSPAPTMTDEALSALGPLSGRLGTTAVPEPRRTDRPRVVRRVPAAGAPAAGGARKPKSGRPRAVHCTAVSADPSDTARTPPRAARTERPAPRAGRPLRRSSGRPRPGRSGRPCCRR